MVRRRKVYLAGPMGLVTEDEARGWRSRATKLLNAIGIDTIDPFDLHPATRIEIDRCNAEGLDYTDKIADVIVEGDLDAIDEADAILVNTSEPGWGTSMEVAYGHRTKTPVFAFGAPFPTPIWLLYHVSEFNKTVEEAIGSIDITFNNELIQQREGRQL